jgi:ABC-type sugar transport system ATPase subunit
MTAVRESALCAVNISKRYGKTQALDNVSLSIDRGESIALIGANGAGKSTLVRMFTGAAIPDSGSVIVDGRAVELSSVRVARKHGIGYVPQELNVAPDLTVAENVLSGGWQSRFGLVRTRASARAAAQACSRVGLDVPTSTIAARLSPTACRLVMIARSLVMSPTTLVLDEPTAALAANEAERLVEVLNQLRAEGQTLIYISHRMEEISRLCDSLTVMRDGKLLMRAPATRDTVAEAVEIGIAGGVDGWQVTPRAAVLSKIESTMSTALRVEHISNRVLDNVSIEVGRGEIIGLAGLLGSGRTELLRAIAGADRVSHGSFDIFGQAKSWKEPATAIAAGVALLPEDRRNQGGLLSLSVRDNLMLPSLPAFRCGWVRTRQENRTAEESIERFGIGCSSSDAILANLSGGNQQKVILTRWLLNGARLLLLDEPTAGIDVVAKAEIMRLIRAAVEDGRAALMASSELSEMCGYCDRIYVMRDGVVTAEVAGDIAPGALAKLCGEQLINSQAG